MNPLSLNPPTGVGITTTTITTCTSTPLDDHHNPDDPETSRLIPASTPPPKRHTVRVQGQLVLVKSVSVNNLTVPLPAGAVGPAGPTSGASSAALLLPGGGGGGGQSQEGGAPEQSQEGMMAPPRAVAVETAEERRARVGRDRQLRGYGIGGRGNIRRPTEVAFGGTPGEGTAPKKSWNLREKLGLGVPVAKRV